MRQWAGMWFAVGRAVGLILGVWGVVFLVASAFSALLVLVPLVLLGVGAAFGARERFLAEPPRQEKERVH